MLAICLSREDTVNMSFAETHGVVQHTIPQTIQHRLDDFPRGQLEYAFAQTLSQETIDRCLMSDQDGTPNMVNTAWVMKALVYERTRPSYSYGHTTSMQLTNHGWEINVSAGMAPEQREFAIGHEIGHLICARHEVTHHKVLYEIGKEYTGSNFATEVLCDYISARMLGYVTEK